MNSSPWFHLSKIQPLRTKYSAAGLHRAASKPGVGLDDSRAFPTILLNSQRISYIASISMPAASELKFAVPFERRSRLPEAPKDLLG